MNKFAAMMKDSFKEAIDGWIFPVMLVLSGIVIVLVGSLSFAPLPPDRAIPKMIPTGGGPASPGMGLVSADRGADPKLIRYFLVTTVTDVKPAPGGAGTWQDEATFTVEFASGGFGGGVEVDDDKKPKKVDITEMFADPFKEAVRTWASVPGLSKPKFTDALAKDFIAAQLQSVARLNVTRVEKVEGNKYAVTTSGATTPVAWPHAPSLLFGAVSMSFLELPLGSLIHLVEDTLVNGIGGWVVLLAGVVVTAGFVPNMMRKGAIDLLLTKPMSRPTILLMKYLGGLLFVLLLTGITVGGVWVAIGLRTGVWATGILFVAFTTTFYFAILYACSTLLGVLTRNAIVSIVVTIVFWFVVWLIGTIHNTLTVLDNFEIQRPPAARKKDADPKDADKKKDSKDKDAKKEEAEKDAEPEFESQKPPRGLVKTFDVLNTVTPRTKDLGVLTTKLISQDLLSDADQRQAGLKLKALDWGEVLGVAGAYIGLFLGLALLRFVTRSY